MNPKFGIKILQILQGHSVGFHFLISGLKPPRDFLFWISEGTCFQICGPKYDTDLVPFKNYELDLQKIVKYALDYNGSCFFFLENFIHYFRRRNINNFVHFSSKCMYIVMVYRDGLIFM